MGAMTRISNQGEEKARILFKATTKRFCRPFAGSDKWLSKLVIWARRD